MRQDSLDKLRTQIQKIEGRSPPFKNQKFGSLKGDNGPCEKFGSSPVWSFGLREVDQFFPQGLPPHALHEIMPALHQDSWAALSFSLALMSRRAQLDQRPLLWCSSAQKIAEFGGLYGQGLKRFNIDPARFIIIETSNDTQTAFVLEEALKSNRLCAVLGLIDALDLTPSRRLSLLASKGKTPALLMTKSHSAGIKTTATRWQVAASLPDRQFDTALPQQAVSRFSLPQLTWQVALTRNRQGPADKKWYLEFPSHDLPFLAPHQKAFCFTQPSPFRNRKSQPFENRGKAA